MEDKEIEKLKTERGEYLVGWKRAKADLQNYKKEEAERRQELLWRLQAESIGKVLPVFDGFDRVGRQLATYLVQQGVEEVPALGEKFDPEIHEAVGEVDGKQSGEVAEVVERGYLLQGKLLRPARVIVVK
jgi:molecular chaperone GrpE